PARAPPPATGRSRPPSRSPSPGRSTCADLLAWRARRAGVRPGGRRLTPLIKRGLSGLSPPNPVLSLAFPALPLREPPRDPLPARTALHGRRQDGRDAAQPRPEPQPERRDVDLRDVLLDRPDGRPRHVARRPGPDPLRQRDAGVGEHARVPDEPREHRGHADA